MLFSVFESASFLELSYFSLLWHVASWAVHLWLGFQFCALQYLQFLSFGLVPYFPEYVSLLIASSSSFPWYIKSFSFNNLSRSFLSLIDVMKFDASSSVLESGKWHSFSSAISLSHWSPGVSVSVCFALKKSRYMFLFGN